MISYIGQTHRERNFTNAILKKINEFAESHKQRRLQDYQTVLQMQETPSL
jgi:hypothetical protein